jgi:hypothetical protein
LAARAVSVLSPLFYFTKKITGRRGFSRQEERKPFDMISHDSPQN